MNISVENNMSYLLSQTNFSKGLTRLYRFFSGTFFYKIVKA